MSKKTNLPEKAPRFGEGEWMAGAVTVVLCAISALALAFHIFDSFPKDKPEAIMWAFTSLAGLFAFGMGLLPMMLARAHGSALEGGTAQSFLGLVVFLFIIVDMALQVHAMKYLMEMIKLKPPAIWWLIGISAAFQAAAFVVRGALYGATREIQELIDARAQELELAATYAKEQQLAKRRDDYAAKRSNVVNMR